MSNLRSCWLNFPAIRLRVEFGQDTEKRRGPACKSSLTTAYMVMSDAGIKAAVEAGNIEIDPRPTEYSPLAVVQRLPNHRPDVTRLTIKCAAVLVVEAINPKSNPKHALIFILAGRRCRMYRPFVR
jgi:hypothetical protein